MNDDFEKYLGRFSAARPSAEFRRRALASARRAWRPRRASALEIIFSVRSLLWAQAAVAAAALVLAVIENDMTGKLLAGAQGGQKLNGTDAALAEICREAGLNKSYLRTIAAVRNLRPAGRKQVDFAAYRKTVNALIEEDTIQ